MRDVVWWAAFVQYLHPVGVLFFSLLLYRPLFVRLWDLRDAVRFLQTGGDGDQDVEEEGERRLCLRPVFFNALLFWVLVPRCPWLSWC